MSHWDKSRAGAYARIVKPSTILILVATSRWGLLDKVEIHFAHRALPDGCAVSDIEPEPSS
jgi:hypothetical protein